MTINKTVTLTDKQWNDIVLLVDRGLDDLKNFSPKESDDYTDEELDDHQRLLQQEATAALNAALS